MKEQIKEYPVVIQLPVPWENMDAFGHVNNTAYCIGITGARQTTIANIAQGLLDRTFFLNPDQPFENFQKQFSAIRGIGE